eukprot:scaffold12250_cov150-Skeletonema_dohrnii-CCMP3373.AAC.1
MLPANHYDAIEILGLKLEQERRCLAFCSVLREAHLISNDLSSLIEKKAPPASQSSIAAVNAARTSIKAIALPIECVKLICDFAVGSVVNYVFRKCLAEQRRRYSRLPGKIVLQNKAQVGERVRRNFYPVFSSPNLKLPQNSLQRGVIISKDCDHGTEIAVKWDNGTVSGNTNGGLKCGKKGQYALVYE